MATPLGHFSVLAFHWLFPGSFSLIGLAVGSQLPDLDGLFTLFRGLKNFRLPKSLSWKEWKKLYLRVWFLGFMDASHGFHTVMGVFLTLPIGIVLTVWFNSLFGRTGEGLMLILGSVLVGGLSHLILDLPAHRSLRYFTIFEKPRAPPFTLFKKMQFFKKRYPFTEVEAEEGYPKYFSLSLFNYLMMSNLFPVIAAGVVLVLRML